MRKQITSTVIVYIILILASISMLIPFLWMALTAVKTISETTQVDPFVIIPKTWQWHNFVEVIKSMNFPRLYLNTLLLIAIRVILAVLTANLAGYAMARLNFKGKGATFALVIFQMMIPVQLFIIPQYVMVSKLHMTNTIFGLVFPGIVSAFGTFLMRQQYMGLPKELEEAARLDGCSIPQTFFHVMIPLSRSSMIALGIFTSVFAYKELMWPMIVCPDSRYTTLASALAKMQGQYATNYPQLMAAALISCIPMIVLYIIFQRQFIEGIATSGVKL